MDFQFAAHQERDANGNETGILFTVVGECVKCKPQASKGVNSLLIMRQTALTANITKINMECLVCRHKYVTNLKKPPNL